MTIAHYFTFLRLLVVPFFSFVYLYSDLLKIDEVFLPYILIVILALCELTDIIDGFLARKKGQVTDTGKILDPVADSITHVAVFFTFTQGIISLPLMLIFVFLYREFLINAFRTVCALHGFALAARTTGKIKTSLQAACHFFILILMVPYSKGFLSLDLLQKLALGAAVAAALFSVFSAFDYLIANKKYLDKLL